MKTNLWKKIASVTRQGRFFYRAERADARAITVAQSTLNNAWTVQASGGPIIATRKTAKAAMDYAEGFFRIAQ